MLKARLFKPINSLKLMKIISFEISVLAIVFLPLFSAQCKKDDPAPYNPLNGKTTAVFNPGIKYGRVSDVDGNVYKTVKIGSQVWMAENLRTTHYRNGDSVPNIMDNAEWGNLNSGAYCNYNNTTNMDTIATYGRLYNWYAVADYRNLAPEGWRVADIMDWDILIEYLGGDTIASNKLKETGNLHWEDPFESDNSSGFTALPGGRRYKEINTNLIGSYGVFWAMPEYNETTAGFLYLFYFDSNVYRGLNFKVNGYSVRCIKE